MDNNIKNINELPLYVVKKIRKHIEYLIERYDPMEIYLEGSYFKNRYVDRKTPKGILEKRTKSKKYSDFDYSFNIPYFDVIPYYGDFINIIPKQKNNLLIYKKKI
jgi:hypothetical protein